MRLPGDLGALTYCLNVHPTQTWAETREALTGPARAVKAAISPTAPFAIGLRLSAETVAALRDPDARDDLRAVLAAEGFEPITVNGFPYGPFHGRPVKDAVYEPDWRAAERLAYTCALADLMADLNPAGAFVSLSTVPGGFRARTTGAEAAVADGLIRAAAHCARLAERTGVRVAIAVEPEPACLIETVAEAVAFFAERLFSRAAVARMAALSGLGAGEAADALRRHLGLCYDVCHAAVAFEDPGESLAALAAAGVPVHKLQLSSALRLAAASPAARAALARFAEPTYFHQTTIRAPGGMLRRFDDLPEALACGDAFDGAEWRTHFHAPVFLEGASGLDTTQAALVDVLARHRAAPIAPHLEVETYTWDVLPDALRAGTVTDSVTRELRWTLERLTA